jgi:hypothetical protein
MVPPTEKPFPEDAGGQTLIVNILQARSRTLPYTALLLFLSLLLY